MLPITEYCELVGAIRAFINPMHDNLSDHQRIALIQAAVAAFDSNQPEREDWEAACFEKNECEPNQY